MPAPVPYKAEYWANMGEWAGYCDDHLAALRVSDPPYGQDPGLAFIYYDQELCGYYVKDHFGGSDYDTWIQNAFENYVYYYVNDPAVNGNVTGFRNFTEGPCQDVLRGTSREADALDAIKSILANGAYVNSGDVTDDLLSREASYAMMTFINAARAGETLDSTQTARRDLLLDKCLGHIDQWCTSLTADYFRPFMGSITAQGLIYYYLYVSQDSRIIPALITLENYSWANCWKADDGAWGQGKSFLYTDRTGFNDIDDKTQPDLNMLIVPTYGFLWWQTGDQVWRDRGDLIWEGGVSVYDGASHQYGAYLGTRSSSNPSGKQYDQQLRWGPRYIEWGESAPVGSGDGTFIPSPIFSGLGLLGGLL